MLEPDYQRQVATLTMPGGEEIGVDIVLSPETGIMKLCLTIYPAVYGKTKTDEVFDEWEPESVVVAPLRREDDGRG